MATAPDNQDAREANRKALFTRAPMLDRGFPFATVRIRNLSEIGAGGIASELVSKGQRFAIALPGIGPVEGEVRWARGVRFGFVFDTPIDLGDLKLGDITQTRLPGRYTDKKRYRTGSTQLHRPGFHFFPALK